jgi:hypothetical protein
MNKLQKARKAHSSDNRVNMAAYRISGYNDITEQYISFDGVVKLTGNTVGTLFRRHKELAAAQAISLSIQPI